ncbi:MAG: hypothetical protein ACUVQG_07895, partial [Thermogutta sp.]
YKHIRDKLWFAGNRRSDTLTSSASLQSIWLWFAGNRRSDTLLRLTRPLPSPLWFAGNRRSDTLFATHVTAKK